MKFEKIQRLLLPHIIDGVLNTRRNSNDRLVEKMQDINFVTRSIVQTSNDINIELQIIDDELFCQLLAGEANRFLLASLISFQRASQTQLNNAAWQAVEHYYAAYYAVHYLIRITGVSLTNLDTNMINLIVRNQLVLPTITPSSGLYTIRYNDATKTMTLYKNLKKGSGGSHQDAWQLWVELVDKLKTSADSDPVEYISESLDLTAHKLFLIKSTGKYNPPEVRGEINYQFKGGSWIFEKNSSESIRRLQSAIVVDTITHAADIKINPISLISNNKIIIYLARKIFSYSSEKYPRSIARALSNKYSSYLT